MEKSTWHAQSSLEYNGLVLHLCTFGDYLRPSLLINISWIFVTSNKWLDSNERRASKKDMS